MHPAVLVAFSVMVPLACLGLLMGLSWLEDRLDDDVNKPGLSHPPVPILAMPDRTAASLQVEPGAEAVQISPGTQPEVAPPVPALDLGEFPDPMVTPAT